MTDPDNNERDGGEMARFARMVSAYGARPDAWPEPERERALALLEASAQARRLLAEAAETDGWLDALEAPPASESLRARILSGAPAFAAAARQAQPGRVASRTGLLQAAARLWERLIGGPAGMPAFRPAFGIALAGVVGLLLGLGGVFSTAGPQVQEEEILAMALVGGGIERYELGERP